MVLDIRCRCQPVKIVYLLTWTLHTHSPRVSSCFLIHIKPLTYLSLPRHFISIHESSSTSSNQHLHSSISHSLAKSTSFPSVPTSSKNSPSSSIFRSARPTNRTLKMGATQSRHRYRELAHSAFESAREIQRELGGPRIWGAIPAYIDGRISAERLIRLCTQIEVFLSSTRPAISLIHFIS